MKQILFLSAILLLVAPLTAQTRKSPLPQGLTFREGEKAARLQGLAVSGVGQWFVSAHDEKLVLWSAVTAKPLGVFVPPDATAPFEKVAVARSATIFGAQDDDNTIFVYDVAHRRLDSQIKVESSLYGWAISPDGKTLAIATDKGIELRDCLTGVTRKTLAFVGPSALQIEFGPNNSSLLVLARPQKGEGENAIVHLLDASGKTLSKTTLGDFLSIATLSPDGKAVAASWNEIGRIYAVPTGKIVGKFGASEESDNLSGFLFWDNANRIWMESASLAPGSASTCTAYDAHNGKPVAKIALKQEIFGDAGFSSAKTFIARDESGQIHLYNPAGRELGAVVCLSIDEQNTVSWLQKRPDGKWNAAPEALPLLRFKTAAGLQKSDSSPQFTPHLSF